MSCTYVELDSWGLFAFEVVGAAKAAEAMVEAEAVARGGG